MLKEISSIEFKEIYKTRITKDFPSNEVRPLATLMKLYDKHNYKCLIYTEDNKVMAYACFIYSDSFNNVLLDHYAVDKDLRGTGIGSKFLKMLSEYWGENVGIIIEAENPNATTSEDERQIRTRRINFYIKNNAILTNISWLAFNTEFNILYLAKSKIDDEIIANDLVSSYSLALPKMIMKLATKISVNS